MPRTHRAPLLALLLLALPLAGCVGGAPDESGDVADDAASPPAGTTAPPPSRPASLAGFLIDGPVVEPLDGRNRSLREDDGARIRWTLAAPADGGEQTAFVSFVLNGEVVSVETVRLQPGENRSFEHVLEEVRGLDAVSAEVRAGSSRASASADVLPWPRTGETAEVGVAKLRVNRWLKNQTSNGTLVNVTLENVGQENLTYLRAKILCVDAAGNVTSHGHAEPALPAPGAPAMTNLDLPGCGTTMLYGVELKGHDARGEEVYMRVLFVDKGWVPPASMTSP